MMGRTERPSPVELARPFATYRRLWITLGVIFLSDQFTKWVIVEWSGFELSLYPPFGGHEIIPGFFNLVYTVNYGAAWGMMEGFSWLLILLAFLVLILVVYFRKDLYLHRPFNQLCFGLICGGIIGNTLDRIFRGHVVDFLDFHTTWYRWPTFNVADSAIVVGTFMYIWLQFRQNGGKSD